MMKVELLKASAKKLSMEIGYGGGPDAKAN
jgi:hypothetical protein